MQTARPSKNAPLPGEYKFRKANLLDIPFIFNLMWEGGLTGSFTARLLGRGGDFFAMRLLLSFLALPRFFKPKNLQDELLIFTLNRLEIGFIKFSRTLTSAGHGSVSLELCAISEDHRDQGHGSRMLRMFIETLPDGDEISVYCTKYARAMQHILRKLKFKLDKHRIDIKLPDHFHLLKA